MTKFIPYWRTSVYKKVLLQNRNSQTYQVVLTGKRIEMKIYNFYERDNLNNDTKGFQM